MTFEDRETSVETGQPVELYHFQLGTDDYRYTSAEDVFNYSGQSYLPRQITRSAPRQADGERSNDLKVTLPSNDPVCAQFIGVVPGQSLYLTIIRVHRDDTGVFNLWTGRIIGATYARQGAVCELSGLTSESAFNRPIPRFKYQGLCNHVLYDSGCQVDPDSQKHTAEVTDVTGNTITVDNVSSNGPDWAVGGYVSDGGVDHRMVMAQSGDTLTLKLPFNGAVLGKMVDVFAGCDHKYSTCRNKFFNGINYGGFPFVPSQNPFETGL